MKRKLTEDDEFEKEFSKWNSFEFTERKRKKRKAKKPVSKSNFFRLIVVNVVLFYVFSHLLAWQLPFLSESFSLCLPIINFSLVANIFGNFLFLFIEENKFYHFIRLLLNLIGSAFIYSLYRVFPFNFSSLGINNFELIMRFALIAGILGLATAGVIEFLSWIFFKD